LKEEGAEVPAAVVTVMGMGPVEAGAATVTVAVTWVSLSTVMLLVARVPNCTWVAVANPVPVMTTTVPGKPLSGVRDPMVGKAGGLDAGAAPPPPPQARTERRAEPRRTRMTTRLNREVGAEGIIEHEV
jgi:hypothetical protein